MNTLGDKLRRLGPLADNGTGRWGVAVSGGGDSVALLGCLRDAGVALNRLVVLHYDHGWRQDSGQWADWVRALASKAGVQVRVGRSGGGRPLTNAEAQAREARYGWFAQMAAEEGLAGVLTGHNRGDVVETLLMRLGRGSALGGLAAMSEDGAVLGVRVVRPLLDIGREELRDYLRQTGQDWLEDPTNADSYRGRVRALLPLLAQAGLDEEAMAASAMHLRRAEGVLDELGLAMLGEVARAEEGGWVVDLPRLRALPEELGLRVVWRLMRALSGQTMAPRTSKRQALWARLKAEERGAATLGGAKWDWSGLVLRVLRE